MPANPLISLPPRLVDAVKSQQAVLFLGAGAGRGAPHPDGKSIPSGDELKALIADKFLGGALKDRPLTYVSEIAANESDLISVQKFIKDILVEFGPTRAHTLLPKFRWHSIVTTNYDTLVEAAYASDKARLQNLVIFFKNGQQIEVLMKETPNSVPFLKLHGCIDHYTDREVPFILTTEQYARYEKNRSRLFARFKEMGYELPIIFCGYSISDPHIQTILFDLFDSGIFRPMFYVVQPGISEFDQRYWGKHRITPIDATFENFMDALDAAVAPASRSVPRTVGGGSATIRTFYRVANAAESSELLSFLQDDADHVRTGMPIEQQDAKEFYHGYDRGWGGIAQKLDVERPIVEDVLLDAILEDEAQRAEDVELHVIKAPAGGGKTIALKRIAWDAAHEFEKLVLFMKPSGAIRKEVIKEISDLTATRVFLFVDRAAVRVDELAELIRFCTSQRVKISLITAERDNEWNVRCEELEEHVSKEFPLRNLSERDVDELLKRLEQHRSLGMLEGLSYEDRKDALMTRAERQLLVALHEATLGEPFQKIVNDEYRRILPTEAQLLYLDVCTLNRLGVPVRAGLISRVSGVRFEDFEKRFLGPLEHVVNSYIDKYVSDRVYVARHQHVAEMVFATVLINPEQKYDQLVRIIQGLNIDYSSDFSAYKQLLRGRAIGETFQSAELGRKFFRTLSEVGGNDAYFYQQKAVFEIQHAQGDLKQAEYALDKASELAPHDKSIRHTAAVLARDQALATTNTLLRTKYRNLARTRLQGLTGSDARQAYGFHTLALVELDELRDLLADAKEGNLDKLAERQVVESSRTVADLILRGLQQFPEEASLLSVEADYRRIVNEDARALEALKRAFEANPRQDWVAKRLSHVFMEADNYEGAKATLAKCLAANPNSQMMHFEMGRLLSDHGNSQEKAKAIEYLRRGFIEGDLNYQAQFWYARELFMHHRYDEASRYFDRLKAAPNMSRLINKKRGIICEDDGSPTSFPGMIAKRYETFVFVRCNDFQRDIFAHSSAAPASEWIRMVSGTKVAIEIGFTMRGATATQIRLH